VAFQTSATIAKGLENMHAKNILWAQAQNRAGVAQSAQ
jgi:hypothetical protein